MTGPEPPPLSRPDPPGPRAEGNAPCVVYLAGYGRSGSTLFEQRLARAHGGLALGEVARFLLVAQDPESRCSCGARIGACDVWGPVLAALAERDLATPAAFRRMEGLRRSVEGTVRAWRPGAGRAYAGLAATILAEAERAARPPGAGAFAFVIDSSKTAYAAARRPWALARLAGLDVRVIHVVRDSRGVVTSMRKGLNRHMERSVPARSLLPTFRASVGWVAANRAAERCERDLGKARYVRVRYEDFALDPDGVVGALAGFLPAAAPHRRPEGAVHQVAGNRARLEAWAEVRPDLGWKVEMAPWEQALVAGVLRPWMRRYGYCREDAGT